MWGSYSEDESVWRPLVGLTSGWVLVSLYYHRQLVNKLLIPSEILDFLNKDVEERNGNDRTLSPWTALSLPFPICELGPIWGTSTSLSLIGSWGRVLEQTGWVETSCWPQIGTIYSLKFRSTPTDDRLLDCSIPCRLMEKRDDDFYLLMHPLRHDHSSSCVSLPMHAGDERGDGGYGVETQASGAFLCVLGLARKVNSPCICICFSSSNANSLSFNRYT